MGEAACLRALAPLSGGGRNSSPTGRAGPVRLAKRFAQRRPIRFPGRFCPPRNSPATPVRTGRGRQDDNRFDCVQANMPAPGRGFSLLCPAKKPARGKQARQVMESAKVWYDRPKCSSLRGEAGSFLLGAAFRQAAAKGVDVKFAPAGRWRPRRAGWRKPAETGLRRSAFAGTAPQPIA
jgi:hypothetical protein